MNEALSYSAAFMLGLMGSPHCVGMCGGIAGLLASTTRPKASADTLASDGTGYTPVAQRHSYSGLSHTGPAVWLGYLYIGLFQLGRLCSYALLGALAGGLVGGLVSASSFVISDVRWISLGLRLLASAMLIAVALSMAGWGGISQSLEALGARLWQKIQPLTRPLLPVDSSHKALRLGALWGLLPCGLIYSALAWAALSGSAANAASLMFCFGLGTTPAILGISGLAASGQLSLNTPRWRRVFAVLLIALAIGPWLIPSGGNQHHSHSQHQHHMGQ